MLFDLTLVPETLTRLLGLGRFETRGEVITGKEFPYIDINKFV